MIKKLKVAFNFFLISSLFLLSSCGFSANMIKNVKSETSTYVLGDLFTEHVNPEKTKLYVNVVDLVNLKSYKVQTALNKIKLAFEAQGYTVVKNKSDANLVIIVSLRNFSSLKDTTVSNLKKYCYYKDVTGGYKIDNHGVSIDKVNFSVLDEMVGFGSSDVTHLRTNTVMNKVLSVDFASGIALGGLAGFFIGGVSPVSLVLGSLIGAVVTSVAQILTVPSSYAGIVNIKISTKLKSSIKSKQKSLSTKSKNISKESYIEFEDDWYDYHSDLMIFVENTDRFSAKRRFLNAVTNNVPNILS